MGNKLSCLKLYASGRLLNGITSRRRSGWLAASGDAIKTVKTSRESCKHWNPHHCVFPRKKRKFLPKRVEYDVAKPPWLRCCVQPTQRENMLSNDGEYILLTLNRIFQEF
jgi:hypothetical protein